MSGMGAALDYARGKAPLDVVDALGWLTAEGFAVVSEQGGPGESSGNLVVDDISHEGLRTLLREEGVTFQRLKTWKASKDPRYAQKKARVEQLYAIADRDITPKDGDPEVIFCVDEFGLLNLQPRPGRQWAAIGGTSSTAERQHRQPTRQSPA